jgi:hypothetical protein
MARRSVLAPSLVWSTSRVRLYARSIIARLTQQSSEETSFGPS